jgi:hypothetical protein
MSYALRFYIYLFVADVVAVVLAVWLTPFGANGESRVGVGSGLSDSRRRSPGVWPQAPVSRS